jgi:hypothetical protein
VLPGLLGQLPDRCLLQVLLARPGFHETARQRPLALERRNAPLHQQHVQLTVPDGQRHHVHRDRDRTEGPRVVTGLKLHQVLLMLRYS